MALSLAEISLNPTRQTSANPYEADLYTGCWLEHLADKNGVAEREGDFVIHRKPLLKVPFLKDLMPLRELKICGGHTAWFNDLTEVRAETLQNLHHQLDWDYFHMVWTESRKPIQAFRHLRDAGYTILHSPIKPMHMADLSGGYEAYLARKKSSNRYNLRKKLKDAQKAKPELVLYGREEDIEPFFEQFFALHIPYWQAKTGASFFSDPAERDFTVGWARALHQAGQLRLHGLKLNGRLATLSMSFIEGDTLYWPLTINTGEGLEYFPGIVGLQMRIQEAIAEGCRLYNMGCGAMTYKLEAQCHEEKRHVAVIINPRSWKGRLAGRYFQWKANRSDSGAVQV